MLEDRLRGRALQRSIAVLGAVAFLVQGYNQSMMNGFLTLNTFLSTIPQIDTIHTTGAQLSHNATIEGLVVAIYEAGCALGALSCLIIGDRLGRTRTMMVAGSIAAVGIIIQASTYSLGQIIAGRIVTGFGIGIYTGTVPMYVSETAETRRRGPLVLIEGVFALGGLALASWVNFGFFYVSGAVNWRFPIAFQLFFIVILLVLTPFLPESPRWLIKKERLEDATRVIARLLDRPIDDTVVAHEVAIIHAAVQSDTGHRKKYSSNPFSMGKSRHLQRTVLACTITMITQMTGINIIPFYSGIILETTLGYSGTVARLIGGCLQITLALGGLLACFTIEKFGRRKLMLSSTFSMVICQAAVAGLSSDLTNPAAGKAALFFYFFSLFTLPIGMFIVPFLYAAEIAPLGVRHQVTAMAAATSWLFNFMVAEVTPVAFTNIKWKYYIVYSASSAAGCILIYLFYPETKGRSLEEIDTIFIQSKSIFDTVRVANNLPFEIDILETLQNDAKLDEVSYIEKA